jgi:hypothetical protein
MTSDVDELRHAREGKFPGTFNLFSSATIYRFLATCLLASALFVMYTFILLFLSSFNAVSGISVETSSHVPDYFQTTPELYAGQTSLLGVSNAIE